MECHLFQFTPPTFEIYFLDFPWEIVSGVISDNYLHPLASKKVFLLQGFCTVKTEIVRFPIFFL